MSYSLRLHRSAQRELDRLSESEFRPLDAAILALESDPRPFGVQKLKEKLFRVRVGRWRIIYAVLDETREVIILRVTRRNEQTYRPLLRRLAQQ
ncbi:MAG: type II toxin-antitoxin system RelE/ParE family toxin [Candidatus Omnitrophica bacterium]|nr:type II toxin-antitoxin system RelE/ParE family toxin [Candidatus Omnitrophota bacterium]